MQGQVDFRRDNKLVKKMDAKGARLKLGKSAETMILTDFHLIHHLIIRLKKWTISETNYLTHKFSALLPSFNLAHAKVKGENVGSGNWFGERSLITKKVCDGVKTLYVVPKEKVVESL